MRKTYIWIFFFPLLLIASGWLEFLSNLTPSDCGIYMDNQQAINLALVRRFEEKGIIFAYPTRTLNIEAPVPVRMAAEKSVADE